MAGSGREQSASANSNSKETTTPLLANDLENAYGATTPPTAAPPAEKKPPQTLWEWTKAEVACYSKYMCPVIIANSIVLILILAYFGVLS